MKTRKSFTRRQFMWLCGMGTASAALAACGATPTPAPAQPTQAPATQAVETTEPEATAAAGAAAAKYQECTLQYWIWHDPQRETVQKRCDLFTAKYPQVKVKVETIPWGEYWPKLQTAIAAGTPPDLMWMHPGEFKSRVAKGVFVNLQPYIDASAELQEMQAAAWPTCVANYQWNCEQYGIPRNAATVAVGFNEDLVKEAGLPLPTEVEDEWDWNKLLEYAKALTKTEGDTTSQWGWYGSAMSYHLYGPVVYSNGGQLIDQKTWRAVCDSEQTIQAFQFLSDMVLKDRVDPGPQVIASGAGSWELFSTGKIAMISFGSWECDGMNEAQNLHYNVAQVPFSPYSKNRTVHTIGLSCCVPVGTKYREEASGVALIKWSKEAQEIVGPEIPVRADVGDKWASRPPANRIAYLKELEYGKVLPVHPTVTEAEMYKVLDDQLTLIYTGKIQPKEGLTTAAQGINALVDQAGAIPSGFEACS